MEVEQFDIEGPLLIKGRRFHDERGYFSETYNRAVFEELGLPDFVQDNLSLSKRGVFRGMHWQTRPHPQGKLVTCLSGSIKDFIIDIRRSSPTFGQTIDLELNAKELQSFWVPEGFAHGFAALEDDTLVMYKVTDFWHQGSERGIKLSSSSLASLETSIVIFSDKDKQAPTLEEFARMDPASLF